MGCTSSKGTLTNSIRIPEKQKENGNMDNNQNINEIKNSQKLNENPDSNQQISSQSPEPIMEKIKIQFQKVLKKKKRMSKNQIL